MTPAVPHSRSASQVSLLSDVEAAAPGTADGDARASDDLETRFIDTTSRPSESEPTLPRRRWYAVALLTVTSAFLYADQNLLSPNLSAVAEEFGFDDREKDLYLGGYLQLAFFVVGAPASLIIGWLADKTPRVRLLAVVVAIGEAPCLGTFWVETYWQLFATRALTGVAVGGCLPLLFSVCGDLFPANERAYVATVLTVATGAGIALGQIMAGTVGPAFGWRVPFLLAAAPAMLLALAAYLTIEEPERGAMEQAVRERARASAETKDTERDTGVTRSPSGTTATTRSSRDARDERDERAAAAAVPFAYAAKIDLAKLRRQLGVPSNALILAQGLPGTVPWGMLNAYFVDYLHAQKGLAVEEGTLAVTLFGLGAVVGTVAGGAYGQRVYNRAGPGGGGQSGGDADGHHDGARERAGVLLPERGHVRPGERFSIRRVSGRGRAVRGDAPERARRASQREPARDARHDVRVLRAGGRRRQGRRARGRRRPDRRVRARGRVQRRRLRLAGVRRDPARAAAAHRRRRRARASGGGRGGAAGGPREGSDGASDREPSPRRRRIGTEV